MLIGILADIHDAVYPLRRALSRFDRQGVDQVVTLGDAFDSYEPGGRSAQVASLLTRVGAKGVWGNHDLGLSRQVSDKIGQEADPLLLDFASKLEPQLVIEGCRFSHNEPWLDARKVEELWHFDGLPDTREKAIQSFESVVEKYLFMGHHHRWIVIGSNGRIHWDAERQLSLTSDDRYLVVAAAVCDGWCSIFDAKAAELMPIRLNRSGT
jgi:hypothetical protein